MNPLFIILLVIVAGFLIIRKIYKKKFGWIEPKDSFPIDWRVILASKVAYYNSLSKEEKNLFEYKVQEFLLNCRITGIKTTVDTTDKLLIASSAIIPILKFSDWRYT